MTDMLDQEQTGHPPSGKRVDLPDQAGYPNAMSGSLDRRTFLKASLRASAGAGLVPVANAALGRTEDSSPGRVQRYNRLGRTGFEVSDISFGSSRLRSGEEHLVHTALDLGVNYLDTADSYTGGQSERVIGNAIRGIRDEVVLVSKTKVWAHDDRQSIMRALEGSLRRLGTDHVDVYFNHAVNDVDRLENPEWFEFADRAVTDGKIRYTGLSGHAGRLSEVLDFAITEDLVDVFLVSYNFGQDPAFYEGLTRRFDYIAKQPGLPGLLRRAKEKDMGVVAMKTLMGGRLNDMRPYEKEGATFAQAAFRWTLSNPDVDALVISMTSTGKIHEFLGASGGAAVSVEDHALLKRYAALNGTTYCRQACNDCEGACPFGVPIADVLRTRMYATDYQDVEFARREYAELKVNAAACLSCSGEPCRKACSHGLAIDKLCAPTHGMLA